MFEFQDSLFQKTNKPTNKNKGCTDRRKTGRTELIVSCPAKSPAAQSVPFHGDSEAS